MKTFQQFMIEARLPLKSNHTLISPKGQIIRGIIDHMTYCRTVLKFFDTMEAVVNGGWATSYDQDLPNGTVVHRIVFNKQVPGIKERVIKMVKDIWQDAEDERMEWICYNVKPGKPYGVETKEKDYPYPDYDSTRNVYGREARSLKEAIATIRKL